MTTQRIVISTICLYNAITNFHYSVYINLIDIIAKYQERRLDIKSKMKSQHCDIIYFATDCCSEMALESENMSEYIIPDDQTQRRLFFYLLLVISTTRYRQLNS